MGSARTSMRGMPVIAERLNLVVLNLKGAVPLVAANRYSSDPRLARRWRRRCGCLHPFNFTRSPLRKTIIYVVTLIAARQNMRSLRSGGRETDGRTGRPPPPPTDLRQSAVFRPGDAFRRGIGGAAFAPPPPFAYVAMIFKRVLVQDIPLRCRCLLPPPREILRVPAPSASAASPSVAAAARAGQSIIAPPLSANNQ